METSSQSGEVVDFGMVGVGGAMDQTQQRKLSQQITVDQCLLSNKTNHNKYWSPLKKALKASRCEETNFLLLESPTLREYRKLTTTCGTEVAVLLAMNGKKESVPSSANCSVKSCSGNNAGW
jgi:hypothetical protein